MESFRLAASFSWRILFKERVFASKFIKIRRIEKKTFITLAPGFVALIKDLRAEGQLKAGKKRETQKA